MASNQQSSNYMRSVAYLAAGDTSNAQISDRFPKPTIGPEEVLIDVHAFGLNFADILMRKGLYPDAPSMWTHKALISRSRSALRFSNQSNILYI